MAATAAGGGRRGVRGRARLHSATGCTGERERSPVGPAPALNGRGAGRRRTRVQACLQKAAGGLDVETLPPCRLAATCPVFGNHEPEFAGAGSRHLPQEALSEHPAQEQAAPSRPPRKTATRYNA